MVVGEGVGVVVVGGLGVGVGFCVFLFYNKINYLFKCFLFRNFRIVMLKVGIEGFLFFILFIILFRVFDIKW